MRHLFCIAITAQRRINVLIACSACASGPKWPKTISSRTTTTNNKSNWQNCSGVVKTKLRLKLKLKLRPQLALLFFATKTTSCHHHQLLVHVNRCREESSENVSTSSPKRKNACFFLVYLWDHPSHMPHISPKHSGFLKINPAHQFAAPLLSSVARAKLQWTTDWPAKQETVPVVPHQAVAEVSKQEACRRAWLLWITDGRANPLMDWQVVGVVLLERLQLQWLQSPPGPSPHLQLLDVAWCSAAVVVAVG